MFSLPSTKVYLATGHTDMRKSISTLSIFVDKHLAKDPYSGHIFAFCNQRRNIIKILYWDRNGFCLWQKRLEKERFAWPSVKGEIRELHIRQLRWLTDGLDISRTKGHREFKYSIIC